MSESKKIKTEDIFASSIYDLDIHNLANMNPMQEASDFLSLKYSIAEIGQQDPIVLFKGKVVDGRNRLAALKELHKETGNDKFALVKYKKLPTTLSMAELEQIVIGKETRRHKSPVIKAIQALNYFEAKDKLKDPISMTKAAKIFAVSQGQVSKVLALRKIAGDAVVQKLFTGGSITIHKAKADGTTYKVDSVSPDAIRRYYLSKLDGGDDTNSNPLDRIDAHEMAYAQLLITDIISTMSKDGVNYLANGIKNSIDLNKTSYDKKKVYKYLGLEIEEKE